MINDSYCQCESAGVCSKHNARKTARDVEICQGLNCTTSECLKSRALWELRNAGSPPESERKRIRGVGDAIAAATTAVGIKPCGGCKGRAALVNHYFPLQSPPAPLRTPIDRPRLVKHFIFHMLPLAESHEWVWRKAVARIRANLHRFNGKVIIAIAAYPGNVQEVKKYGTRMKLRLSSFEDVTSSFGDDARRIEFISVVNSIKGEGTSFPGMLERVLSGDPNHVVCYAHNKGGTHGEMAIDEAPHVWCDAMWETVIENEDAAVSALERNAMAGSFLRHGGTGTKGKWHYSGTFFWMRAADVYARNWMYLQKHYGCVEMWPGVHFKRSEVEVLLADSVGETNSAEYWHQTLIPQLQKWRETRYEIAETTPSISVIIPTINRASLAKTLASVKSQKLSERDEVIVVVDDPNEFPARGIFEASGLGGKLLTTGRRSNDWGASPRTLGQSVASGDLTIFMDDDDVYNPGAFAAIRHHARLNPGKPLLFKMKHVGGKLVWATPKLECGNVSTQCIVVPKSVPFGTWGTHYAGDFDFIRSTCESHPPVFVPEVTSTYGR